MFPHSPLILNMILIGDTLAKQILIGLLGPTTASVANLLTIGLVAVTDAFYLGHTTPFWTLVGAGLVGAGFGTLLWAGEEDGH